MDWQLELLLTSCLGRPGIVKVIRLPSVDYGRNHPAEYPLSGIVELRTGSYDAKSQGMLSIELRAGLMAQKGGTRTVRHGPSWVTRY